MSGHFVPFFVRSTGAWDRYRDEVAAGKRTEDEPFDALWRAADDDRLGLERLAEYRRTGSETLLYCAQMFFEESAGHLLRDAEKKKASAA